MNPPMLRIFCVVLLFLTAAGLRAQLIVPIVRYDYITAPHTGFPDSQRELLGALTGELTDGIAAVRSWNFDSIAFSTTPFVGWLDTDVQIRFQFATDVSLTGATFHFADTAGVDAGVLSPQALHLRIEGSSEPFHSLGVLGTIYGFATGVGFEIGGFVTDHVILEIPHRLYMNEWLMMTEAAFYGSPISPVPEPSTYGVFAGIGALGFVLWRRRRVSRNAPC